MTRLANIVALCVLPSALAGAAESRTAATSATMVTIYQCTDGKGRLTVRDSPCAPGQQQSTRRMQRPQDPPGGTAPSVPAPAVDRAEPARPRVLVVHAPRPLYECTRHDGSVYDSESGDGEPRWVPLWTLDYPVGWAGSGAGPRRDARTAAAASMPPRSGLSIPPARERPVPGGPRTRRPATHGWPVLAQGPGTWVRDACHPLPQAEVCARLADRRDAIRTRFFNAQQTERDALRLEERGLLARLANDCAAP